MTYNTLPCKFCGKIEYHHWGPSKNCKSSFEIIEMMAKGDYSFVKKTYKPDITKIKENNK